jgi:hypothetical protein
MLHGNKAFFNLDLRVTLPPAPKINMPPNMKSDLKDVLFDFSTDSTVLWKVNNPLTADQRYKK